MPTLQSYLTRAADESEASLIAQFDHPQRHAAMLTRLAARRLATGDLHTGLMLADRRCRVAPLPESIDLILRAEFLLRLGYHSEALADVASALDLEPEDRIANRKQLTFGPIEHRRAAALHVIEFDREQSTLVAALQVLWHDGTTTAGQAAVVDASSIRGWIAWSGTETLDFIIDDRHRRHAIQVVANPRHRLAAGLGHAADFVIANAEAGIGHWSGTCRAGSKLHLVRAFSGFDGAPSIAGAASKRVLQPAIPHDVTVVVPVYGDLDATRTCLDSLLASLAGDDLRVRVLVVNDASPVQGMSKYLQSLAVDLITNSSNLGFVGAVNAALDEIESGDVVLLNADTVIPPGAVGRLAAAAHSAPGIGTVTPLSNNGELTSLPVPFRENPLPTIDMIEHIDRIAQTEHAHRMLDLPSGIGFCLYITRQCLNAVGRLSNRYERGYGEDVHLCLAAAEAGFRNVCALSVYVGHAGSRSFGSHKRRLVMRNAKRVSARFPHHEAEIDAFVAADPLQTARHDIGQRLMEGFHDRLIVAGPGSATQAQARVETLARAGRCALLIQRERGRALLRAFAPGNSLMAEAAFTLPDELAEFQKLRASLKPDRIEVFDPTFFQTLGLDAHRQPIDLHLADLGGLAHVWNALADTADRIIAPDAAASAFARVRWPETRSKIVTETVGSQPAISGPSREFPSRLGVVLLNETVACRRLVRELASRLPRNGENFPPVVMLGATADDHGLMRGGGLMITGKLSIDEIPAVTARYRLTHLFAISAEANFGSAYAVAARATTLPLAQFAWAPRENYATPGDLAIEPGAGDHDVIKAVAEWMESVGSVAGKR